MSFSHDLSQHRGRRRAMSCSAESRLVARPASRMEMNDPTRSRFLVDHDRQLPETRRFREPVHAQYESSSERASRDREQVEVQQREKMFTAASEYGRKHGSSRTTELRKDAVQRVYTSPSASASASTSRTFQFVAKYLPTSESTHSSRRHAHEEVSSIEFPEHTDKKSKYAMLPSAVTSSVSHTAELKKNYEKLRRENDALRDDVRKKDKLLDEKELEIRSLLQNAEEQTRVLTDVRAAQRSCQAQLDSVQRLVSTADAHSEEDLTQRLHGMNEEVCKISTMMADRVAERFVSSQAKDRTPPEENVLAAIGPVMAAYLATGEGNEDIGLGLQVAFQAYLSLVLRYVISSWTTEKTVESVIEDTYRRMHKAETQAISGNWRALTRHHVLPTYTNDSKRVVEHVLAMLSNIIAIAGLVPPHPDALRSEFRDKISSIVLLAGTFRNMVSGMISGHFDIFVAQPGAIFDRERMVDRNEDPRAGVSQGAGPPQTVLCMTRVGLTKQLGDKTTMLTRAQVVLKSFLY